MMAPWGVPFEILDIIAPLFCMLLVGVIDLVCNTIKGDAKKNNKDKGLL